MTQTDTPSSPRFVYDPDRQPELFDGVLAKRIVAFFVDVIVIFLLMIPAMVIVGILGIVTLGIGFLLFPPLFVIVALAYVALTLGGPRSATVGMRMTAIEMRTWSGQKMFPLLAIMHALVFWFSIAVLTPLILLVGLFTKRRQMLHDLLLGVAAVNVAALAAHESGASAR
ncbi:MAG: RDD family protein [Alphaproteobacteria bacterium]